MNKKRLEKASKGFKKTKSFLISDMFKYHKTEEKINEPNTDLAVITIGVTSFVQPLDVFTNTFFKESLKQQWNTWTLERENMRHVS